MLQSVVTKILVGPERPDPGLLNTRARHVWLMRSRGRTGWPCALYPKNVYVYVSCVCVCVDAAPPGEGRGMLVTRPDGGVGREHTLSQPTKNPLMLPHRSLASRMRG